MTATVVGSKETTAFLFDVFFSFHISSTNGIILLHIIVRIILYIVNIIHIHIIALYYDIL